MYLAFSIVVSVTLVIFVLAFVATVQHTVPNGAEGYVNLTPCTESSTLHSWGPVFATSGNNDTSGNCFAYPAELDNGQCPQDAASVDPSITGVGGVCRRFDQDVSEVVPTAKCMYTFSSAAKPLCALTETAPTPDPSPSPSSSPDPSPSP